MRPAALALLAGLALAGAAAGCSGSRGRGQIYLRISDGWGAMPGFSQRLERTEIEDLVDYVLRLPQEKASR